MRVTGTATKTEWQITGDEVVSCNCAWGCPCQFNALPTSGHCEGLSVIAITRGYFGPVHLDGVTFAQVFHWDGPIHEGNGWRRLILDVRQTAEQRDAIEALISGAHGHPVFEIFALMAPNALPTVIASITFEHDRERRQASIFIPDLAESHIEPIRNPVTREEHRARIDLPDGFEFRVAEIANSARWRTTAGEPLAMEHENTYAQFAHFDWRSDGTTH